MICHEIRKIIMHALIFIKISIFMSLEYLFTARVHNTTKKDCTNYTASNKMCHEDVESGVS